MDTCPMCEAQREYFAKLNAMLAKAAERLEEINWTLSLQKGIPPMLLLTRRPQQRVIIETPSGERIEVVVTAVRGDQVKIGFAAARDVKITREELLESAPCKPS